jgi:peptidoglycan/LPS O-acetylase OafA/YrhL
MLNVEKQRFIGLEWLRFLLGLYVVIYHTIHFYLERKTVPLLDELTSMGFFATSTFFVLSGFLLAHVYLNGNEMREPARSFWVKRFSNLYPIHIFALVLSVLVVTLISLLAIPPDGAKSSIRFVVYDTNEVLARTNPELFQHYMTNMELAFNGLLQLTMLQAWNPYYLTFNAPLWSISALFFFYLTFPYVAPRIMRSRKKWLMLAILSVLYLIPPILVVWHQNYGMPFTGLLQRVPLLRLPEFLAGIVAYGIFRDQGIKGAQPGVKLRLAMVVYLVMSFAVATALFTHGPKLWYFLLHNGLLLPSQLILVYLSALAHDPKSEWLRHWSPRLGAASLSMFALHVPLSGLFMTLEKWLMGDLPLCLSDWAACIEAAGNTENSIEVYGLFLLLVVAVCVIFQERAVTPTRKWLIRHLLPRVEGGKPLSV